MVRTLPAAPAAGVAAVKVIPITTTSVRIVWHPLSEESWNGDAFTGGYRIDYRQITDFPTPVLLQGTTTTRVAAILRFLLLSPINRQIIFFCGGRWWSEGGDLRRQSLANDPQRPCAGSQLRDRRHALQLARLRPVFIADDGLRRRSRSDRYFNYLRKHFQVQTFKHFVDAFLQVNREK